MGNLFRRIAIWFKPAMSHADPVYLKYKAKKADDFTSLSDIHATVNDVYGGLASLRSVEIDRSLIIKEEKLGEGAFGEVHKGTYYNRINIAIKTLKTNEYHVMTKDKFLNEARIMHELKHPNIVTLYGVCREKEPIYLVTEFMNRGDLHTILKRDKGNKINYKNGLLYFAAQIANGMDYLEEQNFVHRDLRCGNILLNTEMAVKISDFGITRLLDANKVHVKGRDSVFPIAWTAPEAQNMWLGMFSSKSDVWSFGVVLFELITYGEDPSSGRPDYLVKRARRADAPNDYISLMEDCLSRNPDERPSFLQLKQSIGSKLKT